jgi:class 3 adenylate cyclase/tetratricopeptide (TPR) repeat protein
MSYSPFVPDYAMRLLGVQTDEPPFVEKAEGAVLFADIVGFTTLSSALAETGPDGAEELSNLLNRFFARMVELVADYGGTVASFAGDAITAVFLFPGPRRTAPTRRAARCALAMQAACREFRTVPTAAGTFTLSMRVGVGVGPVAMAIVGDEASRLEHVLAGRAVSSAIAAEQCAAQGQVLVDPAIRAAGYGIELAPARSGFGLALRVPGARRTSRRALGSVDATAEVVERRLPAFLHPAIAERVHQGRVGLVNERRTVTVMFVDFSNLAADPIETLDRLQRFAVGAVRAIERWGGHLRQIDLGDKGSLLVVAFGAPVRYEQQEERALRCCIELLRLPGGPFRAGITTGRTWCGEVGSPSRREYAIVGDTVNIAARLVQAASPGQALVDRATWAAVERNAVGRRVPALTVRGRDGVVDVWAVRAMQERTEVPTRSSALGSIVGRAAELAAIRAAVGHVAAGKAIVLAIIGEPGIGKSRVAAEAIAEAHKLGFTTATGVSRSLGPDINYLPWRSIWRELLSLDPWSAPSEQETALARFGRHAPLLGPILGLAVPDNEFTEPLGSAAKSELLRSLLAEELLAQATASPIALLFEDYHWIDPSSRALLEHLARRLMGKPVLFLITSRRSPTARHPIEVLTALPYYREIVLDELPVGDATELAVERAHRIYGLRGEPAPETIERIIQRAGGNPFHIEELLSLVHAQGPGQDDDVDLPDSVERVVMARLDQLSEDEKAVLKVASVIGRRFRAEWISGCFPAAGTPSEVARHLGRLEVLGLTPMQAISAAPEYGFRHAITQEVTYNSLTLRMRTLLHEQVGDYIERTFPDKLVQFVDTLAFHYGRTGRVDKQRTWFTAAADHARDAFANEAAIAHYQRLLPLLDGAEAGEALIKLGAVWQLIGRWGDSQRAYLQALDVAEAGDDLALLATVDRELGNLFIYTKSYAEAIDWLTRAEEIFDRLGDQQGLSRALDRLTYALIQQGSYKQASTASHRHLRLATEVGDLSGMSVALDHLGIIGTYTGDAAEALSSLRRSLQAATEAEDHRGVVHAANNLAGLYAARGDHLQALESVVQALRVAQKIGYRQMAGVIIGNIGELYRERGDPDRATDCFTEALRIAVELGDRTSVANRVASLAAIAADIGYAGRAEHRYVLAIELARSLDAPHFLCEWLHDLALLLTSAGRLGEAERCNDEALAIAIDHDERHIELHALLLRLRLRAHLERLSGSDAAREALQLQIAWADSPERAAILEVASELDPALSEAREAAQELYRELNARSPSVRYGRAYERLTGSSLPSGPPLPAVPEATTSVGIDVDELLRHAELLLGGHPRVSDDRKVGELVDDGAVG